MRLFCWVCHAPFVRSLCLSTAVAREPGQAVAASVRETAPPRCRLCRLTRLLPPALTLTAVPCASLMVPPLACALQWLCIRLAAYVGELTSMLIEDAMVDAILKGHLAPAPGDDPIEVPEYLGSFVIFGLGDCGNCISMRDPDVDNGKCGCGCLAICVHKGLDWCMGARPHRVPRASDADSDGAGWSAVTDARSDGGETPRRDTSKEASSCGLCWTSVWRCKICRCCAAMPSKPHWCCPGKCSVGCCLSSVLVSLCTVGRCVAGECSDCCLANFEAVLDKRDMLQVAVRHSDKAREKVHGDRVKRADLALRQRARRSQAESDSESETTKLATSMIRGADESK